MLIHLINMNYSLFNSPLLRKPLQNLPGDFRTISELFLLSSVNTTMFPNITKNHLKHL
jgi:hypothetical protein